MKKGIDTKIISGNIGIPVRPLYRPSQAKEIAKWRLACDNATKNQHLTEDIEHVEVKDECKELPGHIMTLDECEKAYIDMMDKSFESEQYAFFNIFKIIDEPEHVAFLGHELNSK